MEKRKESEKREKGKGSVGGKSNEENERRRVVREEWKRVGKSLHLHSK